MIGVIADDLTGAAELGAVGLRYGLHAEIVMHGELNNGAELICVDTDSRSCTADEAGKRAATAAQKLHAAGARWIYKKVDSVLRGQVTAEVEAVMRQLKLDRALLLPANPSLGRTIRDGQYFVRGKLIHKTEFAQDPEYPRRSSQVLRLIKVPQQFSIRVVNGDHAMPGQTIVVGEASSPQDVSAWAALSSAGILPAGGSEFFNALLAREKLPAPVSTEASRLPAIGRELFVCGTSTQSSREFVAAARGRKQPVLTLPKELMWGADFTSAAMMAITQRAVDSFAQHTRVILAIGLPPVRDVAVAKRLSQNLVQIAENVLAQVSVERVFAEGGATAADLMRRMGWSRLAVERELAPGVVSMSVQGDRSILLTIKPGTYAWPEKWT